MNLFKKLAHKNDIKEEVLNNCMVAEQEINLTNKELNKVRINTNGLVDYTNNPVVGSEFSIEKCFSNLKESLNNFSNHYSSFVSILKELKNILETNKIGKKETKAINNYLEQENSTNHKFLELYSLFVVKVKLPKEQKDEILKIFVEIAQQLNLPIHTHTKEESNI